MRMRNKQRKSSAFPCNAGGRCSLSAVVWSLVGCILLIHFYSLVQHHESVETQVHLNRFPLTRELEEIEEESFQLQPRGKRSPRAAKRRGNKKPSLIDEFLDDSSQIRLLFFPDHKTAFGPTKSTANDSMYYHPGRLWLDTEGNAIQAHGGGILYDERTETYYWYGENKDGPTYQAHKKGTARLLPRPHAPPDKHILNLANESGHSIYYTGDNVGNVVLYYKSTEPIFFQHPQWPSLRKMVRFPIPGQLGLHKCAVLHGSSANFHYLFYI